jgi:prepilin-type N-terminal cleavage/methylation domain-containing protein
MKSRPHERAFTLIEVLAVVFVILILAAIVIPRIVVIRTQSIQQRNNFNGRQIAAAVERLQWDGATLTNLSVVDSVSGQLADSSVDSVIAQLVESNKLYPSEHLTSRQISMYYRGGFLSVFGTQDN